MCQWDSDVELFTLELPVEQRRSLLAALRFVIRAGFQEVIPGVDGGALQAVASKLRFPAITAAQAPRPAPLNPVLDAACLEHPQSARHRRKLERGQVDEIRARYTEGGITQVALAVEYGVSQSLITKILGGKVWA